MSNKNPTSLLKKIATLETNKWIMKRPKKYRTETGRRSFSARVGRIWEDLPEELKTINMKNRNDLESIKTAIKNMNKERILWGIETTEEARITPEMQRLDPRDDEEGDHDNNTDNTNSDFINEENTTYRRNNASQDNITSISNYNWNRDDLVCHPRKCT